MSANKGISFPSPQIPSLLGYNAKQNGEFHICYKMTPSFDASYEAYELFVSHFPFDLSSRTSLIFVDIDIFQNQSVGDAKTPLLLVFDSNRRIKNGCACSIEPNHRKNFTNLDFKKLVTSSVQSRSIHLRTVTGSALCRKCKVVLTLKFKRFDWKPIEQKIMQRQDSLPHFSGHYRQVDLELLLRVLVMLLNSWSAQLATGRYFCPWTSETNYNTKEHKYCISRNKRNKSFWLSKVWIRTDYFDTKRFANSK